MINVEKEIAGKTLTIQTGKIARQAAGSVVLTYGETTLLVAVNAAKEAREDIGYFPLQVEYREKHYASGKIPGGFFKREARPTEGEVLTSRLTDRPIRPLFPKGFKNETQVMITVLQSDGENMADTWAGVGASAALMISNIPWHGPIATVRVCQIDNEFIVLQEELASSGDVNKIEEPAVDLDQALIDAVNDKIGKQISDIVKVVDKQDRDIKKTELIDEVLLSLEESHPEKEKEIKSIIDDQFKEIMREMILAEGVRSDGRGTKDIRDITIDPAILKRVHGSALFTRGETQALVVTTLGSKSDEMIIDSMDEDYKKNYYLHYNFPPYCVGEVGRIGFTSRREIGHGNLAQRAIKPALPDYDDFPYTIRIVSEIMESNGSSSMASVCGGSLSLMCAGAPLKGHVAGIAMGLITDGKRNAILSDILGLEDHLGDMDFKVAGTRDGISAIQLDLKIEGISFELLTEALQQAHEGRMHILDKMYEAVPEVYELSQYAPRILSIQINPEKIGGLIGPGGKNIKKIIEDTQCEVNVDDEGIVTVAGKDPVKCEEAIKLVEAITFDPEVGMEFDGKVTRLMTFGAFVEFAPGREGLVHISELEWHRVNKVEDVCGPGDSMKIKLIKIDDQGRLDFSRKALLEKPEGWKPPPRRDRNHNSRDRGRKPFKGRR